MLAHPTQNTLTGGRETRPPRPQRAHPNLNNTEVHTRTQTHNTEKEKDKDLSGEGDVDGGDSVEHTNGTKGDEEETNETAGPSTVPPKSMYTQQPTTHTTHNAQRPPTTLNTQNHDPTAQPPTTMQPHCAQHTLHNRQNSTQGTQRSSHNTQRTTSIQHATRNAQHATPRTTHNNIAEAKRATATQTLSAHTMLNPKNTTRIAQRTTHKAEHTTRNTRTEQSNNNTTKQLDNRITKQANNQQPNKHNQHTQPFRSSSQ